MRENFIQVENNLSKNIYCVPSFDYPDTSLLFINKERILANDTIHYLPAHGSKKLFYSALCKKEIWQKMTKSDTMQVFVFDEITLKEKPWSEIVVGNLYLRRLTYTYQDIFDNGCMITIR